ncbi:MAG: arginine deiminase-related protein [Bacteroidota bacterium]
MNRHTTDKLLMIRPVAFTFNKETAVDNHYQVVPERNELSHLQSDALAEFDTFVGVLRSNGIQVTVVEDTPDPATPDSIFPNNWVSFHDSGEVVIYPMFAQNRRDEKRPEIIEALVATGQFKMGPITDLSSFEEQNIFLEGTGSMISGLFSSRLF